MRIKLVLLGSICLSLVATAQGGNSREPHSTTSDSVYLAALPDRVVRQCTVDQEVGVGPPRTMKGHDGSKKSSNIISICQQGPSHYSKKSLLKAQSKDWFPNVSVEGHVTKEIIFPWGTKLKTDIGKKKLTEVALNVSEVRFSCDLDEKKIPKKARVLFPTEAEAEENGIVVEIPCNFKPSQVEKALRAANNLIASSLRDLEKTSQAVRSLANNCDKNPSQAGCQQWREIILAVMTANSSGPLEVPGFFCGLEVNAGVSVPRIKSTNETDVLKSRTLNLLSQDEFDASLTLDGDKFFEQYKDYIELITKYCENPIPIRRINYHFTESAQEYTLPINIDYNPNLCFELRVAAQSIFDKNGINKETCEAIPQDPSDGSSLSTDATGEYNLFFKKKYLFTVICTNLRTHSL
jgi:hypothetical protein